MSHGFEDIQFETLKAYSGQPYSSKSSGHASAYSVIKEAYDATASWANSLRQFKYAEGTMAVIRRPTNQANNFRPYTWARIYPNSKSPRSLAITVGIDDDEFCVKIDTVHADKSLRERYVALQGGSHHASPFAAFLSRSEGLAMSLEELVSWSALQIDGFKQSYDQVVDSLWLRGLPLKLVPELDELRREFAGWVTHISEGAEDRNSVCWQTEGGFVFKRHSDSRTTNGMRLGLDPSGGAWAVELNEPHLAADYNPLTSVAVDPNGEFFLMRQGRLQRNAVSTQQIKDEEFEHLTGLVPARIEGKGSERRWYVVTPLTIDPSAIRLNTGDFVARCWSARRSLSTGVTPPVTVPIGVSWGGAESDTDYTIPPKDSTDAKTVARSHGKVWLTLASHLASMKIPYDKCRGPSGFEVDLVIEPSEGAPLLVEIKSDISISDLYTGLGQLFLYRRLIPELQNHRPILLIQEGIGETLKSAIEECGVTVAMFSYRQDGSNLPTFSTETLQLLSGGRFAGPISLLE